MGKEIVLVYVEYHKRGVPGAPPAVYLRRKPYENVSHEYFGVPPQDTDTHTPLVAILATGEHTRSDTRRAERRKAKHAKQRKRGKRRRGAGPQATVGGEAEGRDSPEGSDATDAGASGVEP